MAAVEPTTGPQQTAGERSGGRPGRAGGPPWEWTLRHGPLFGTVNAAGATMAAAMVSDLAEVSPWWAAAAGLAGAGASVLAGAHSGLSRAGLAYRAACWAGAGGWTAHAIEAGAWDLDSLGALVAGSVAGGLLAPVFARHERRETERRRRLLLATSRTRTTREWVDRILRVCRVGVVIPSLVDWDNGAGYSMDVQLPRGGATWKTLARFAEELASDADLPAGCGVEVRAGPSRRWAVIEVSTIDAFAEDVPFGDDYSDLSINNPIKLGCYRNTTPAVADLRETYSLLVGDQGSGKTNELNVFTGQLARCTDVVLCHIDPNGGGLSRPWVMPWVEEKCARPAVDWVAYEPAEAARMTAGLLRVMHRRKAAYFDRMRQANDDKLPVDSGVPAFVVIVDEAAEIMSQDAAPAWRPTRDNLRAIQRQGRAMGILIEFAGLRATAEILGTATVKRLVQLRIGMGIRDQAERAYLFGDGALLDDEFLGRGYGHLAYRGSRPRLFKGLRLLPQQIEALTVAVANRRPDPDRPSLGELGTDWTERWERTLPGLVAADGPGGGPASMDGPRDRTATDGPARPDLAGLGSAEEVNRRAADAAAHARRHLEEAEALRRIAEGFDETAPEVTYDQPRTPPADPPVDGDGPAGTDPRVRMLEILYAAGSAGMSAGDVFAALAAEGLTKTRQAVSDWLRAAVATGQVVQPVTRGPYIHADHADGR